MLGSFTIQSSDQIRIRQLFNKEEKEKGKYRWWGGGGVQHSLGATHVQPPGFQRGHPDLPRARLLGTIHLQRIQAGLMNVI